MGARVGTTNRPLAYCTAENSAPTTKKIWAGSTIRVNRIASASWSGEKSGNSQSITAGVAHQPTTTKAVMAMASGRIDGSERRPPALLVVVGQIAGEYWDEGDRQEPAGQQVVEEVGDAEGGDVDVGVARCAQHPGEDDVPDLAEQPGDEHPARRR